MACFVVSTAVGVGTAIARHVVKHHEKKLELEGKVPEVKKFGSDVKWSKKLAYLELMLFSGSFILAIEHMIHGEITPYPPFFTAASDYNEAITMLKEMGTVGVSMLAILLGAWAIGVFVVDLIKYRKRKSIASLKKAEVK